MAGYIFGGDTPWTYEQLQRRRQIADSMLASLGTPRNVGEGLAEVGKALAIRGMNKRADTRDAELKGEFDQKWGSMFGGGAPRAGSTGGGAAYAALSDPNSPQAIASDTMSALGKGPTDRELLAKTLMAEAGGEGPMGMLAAGAVINNRVKSGGYGDGLSGVIMKPGQFSAWNGVTGYAGGKGGLDMQSIRPSEEAYKVADMLLSGQYSDPTGGATHYYNPSAASPKWGQQGDWQRIGNHVFGNADAGRSGSPATPMDIGALADIAGSPYATSGQKAVVNAILQQQMNSYDPMYNMGLEKARLELDALRNPKPKGEGFTLSPGQQRFDAQGNAIASVSPAAAPRPMTESERAQWRIPPEDKRAYAMTEKGPQVVGGAGVTVKNNIGGEKKYDEKLGGNLADKYIAIQDGAQQAQSKIATLDGLSQALAQSSYTGWGADTLLGVKRAAKSLGLDVGEDLGPEETARALGNQLALQLRSPSNGAGMPGAMSDKDREFLVASVPGLDKTPEGNRRLIDYMMRVEQRNIDVARFAQQYSQKNNGRIDDAFFTALSDWSAKNPLFPEADSPAQTPQNTTSGGVNWRVVE